MLESASHVAALLLEIERAQMRAPLFARVRGDGAAPLIGSSPAIRQVRERIERVAATDSTVLIEGGSGPQPHRGFIEVSGEAAFGGGEREVAGARADAENVKERPVRLFRALHWPTSGVLESGRGGVEPL
jgi:hypothetical protein